MEWLNKILKLLFGDPKKKQIREYWPIVEKINALEPEISALTDDELRAKTLEFRERLAAGETLEDLLPEAFAVTREASKRVLNMRHFDVQLIGGVTLHQGKIAEMKTGEGKTLVSTLPAYLNALEGKGVYVVTVNDYLARRDSQWMGQIFTFLGLKVGLIQAGIGPEERLDAYSCDITYGTNNEFGFDYLRDHLVYDTHQVCQTRRHYAIIDEVDSILIDEARTPLVISGPIQDSTSKYLTIANEIRHLQKGTHFTLDEKHKNIVLTEAGIDKLESDLKIDNIYSVQTMDVAHIAVQCLKALNLYRRDVDYVIKDDEVVIVDEFTGRLLDGRRYSDGLHQAIEAIENVTIKEESQTLASVTFQNYFRLFPKLSGMTGTALTEEAEFIKIYGLEVLSIPTHRDMVRKDMPDLVYKTKEEKYKAVIAEIKTAHQKGQPVLVGTISIETSEMLSTYLTRQNVPHSVLNAKYHEKEAEIISKAGQKGNVIIATNMAGRGTDIVLGEGVCELGGLFVIGTERHESRRIDNQLRGRSGRQGDPGMSRFYVALNDDLMRLFGSDRISRVMETLGLPADTPIEHPLISRSIEKAQSKVEQYYFSIRKQILQYDDVMNKQRETVYGLRNQLLFKQDLDKKLSEFSYTLVTYYYAMFFGEKDAVAPTDDIDSFAQKMNVIFPIDDLENLVISAKTRSAITTQICEKADALYLARKAEYPEGLFEEAVTKPILLLSLDRKWIDHLNDMEVLREGIGLRAWGQKDPLVEYKIEAFELFEELIIHVTEEALEAIHRATLVETSDIPPIEPPKSITYNTPEAALNPPAATAPQKAGRNDECPCGSGRKYKKCCMT